MVCFTSSDVPSGGIKLRDQHFEERHIFGIPLTDAAFDDLIFLSLECSPGIKNPPRETDDDFFA
jgi:hypothetical protein